MRSRDPAFLWRMVIAIIGTGVVCGWIAGHLTGAPLVERPDRAAVHDWKNLDALAMGGHWWQLWWRIPQVMLSDLSSPGMVALALTAGVCWLAFLWHLLRIQGLRDWRLPATLAAVALGVLSIWPTLFLIFWQKHTWGLQESDELVQGMRYFVLGVGLREELAKALCLLPLLILLLPKRDEMVALVVSACVGLGFAIEENINYLTASLGTGTMGRFLTANPYHMALTGLIGLGMYRALRDPANWLPPAIAMFFVLVMAHGLYDTLLAVPMLREYSLGAMIVFALVMYQFFHEVRTLRPRGRDPISLTATFLAAVSLLAAVTFVYISAVAGPRAAADTLMADIVGSGLMVYLFLREMPDSMVSV